jgi:hypothetical protein
MVSSVRQNANFFEINAQLQWKHEYIRKQKNEKWRYRPHVYFPPEVQKVLGLDPKEGNVPIRFVWKGNSKLEYRDQYKSVTIAKDKEELKNRNVRAQELMYELLELNRDENRLFSENRAMILNTDQFSEFRGIYEKIVNRQKAIGEELRSLNVFRGSLNIIDMVNREVQAHYGDLSSALIDYAKTLKWCIENIKSTSESMYLSYKNGLLKNTEYNSKKEQLQSQSDLLTNASQKTVEILSSVI